MCCLPSVLVNLKAGGERVILRQSHRCCSDHWAPPQLDPPALRSWSPSICPSSSLPRPALLRQGRDFHQVLTQRRSPHLPLPGRRTQCCWRAGYSPPKTGGCGCKTAPSPHSRSCCSMMCCNRRCCSTRCCSRRCHKTRTRFHLELCGRCRQPSFLLHCWNPPPRFLDRKGRSS